MLWSKTPKFDLASTGFRIFLGQYQNVPGVEDSNLLILLIFLVGGTSFELVTPAV
jgi:hypothetical protein